MTVQSLHILTLETDCLGLVWLSEGEKFSTEQNHMFGCYMEEIGLNR